MGWKELRDQFVSIIKGVFTGQDDNILGDIADIVIPIVEEVSKIDLNNDGVVQHARSEIARIAEDKGIEWGHYVTDALINAAEGDFLKHLFAAARVAEWLTKALPTNLVTSWLINLAIEWAIGAIKKGVTQLDVKIHDEISKRDVDYCQALGQFSRELTRVTGALINTEHHWGTDLFKVIALPNVNAPSEQAITLTGSLNSLYAASTDQVAFATMVSIWSARITNRFNFMGVK